MKSVSFVVGCIFGIPLVLVLGAGGFLAGSHAWNKYRMDARNDKIWEESIARIVTVKAERGSPDGVQALTAEVVCYEGYYAEPWSLKSGIPSTGKRSMSVGREAMEAEFTTGATLDIDLRNLCDKALRTDTKELPLKFRHNEMNLVVPRLSLKCTFHNHLRSEKYALQTDAGWVGHPYIVAIQEQSLRTLATRADLGSSETSGLAEFNRRWGMDIYRSAWQADKACWGGRNGACDAEMTRYCGKNPG